MDKIEITKHLQLPFHFEEQKLVNDLQKVLQTNWVDHFNKGGYTGEWKSISLYAPNGDHQNIFVSANEEAPVLETELIKGCDYFKEVLHHFECPFLAVRLLNLGSGAYIKPHKDYNMGYENDCFRLHIPITTNPQVAFILDDVLLKMYPGECWYTNVNYTHSVSNGGISDRIHLVIDGARNDWSDELFFSLASKESLLTAEEYHWDDASIVLIIKELEMEKPKGYKQIIRDLQRKIGNA